MTAHLATKLSKLRSFVFLTGAGLSQPSGIPTYRGENGFHTQELNGVNPYNFHTTKYFEENPLSFWKYHSDFIKIVLNNKPNSAHYAIQHFLEYCYLNNKKANIVTQNTESYHSVVMQESKVFKIPPQIEGTKGYGFLPHLFQIHGNDTLMKCAQKCDPFLYSSIEYVKSCLNDVPRCKKCKSMMKPHILLFDEWYDEEYYQGDSSLKVCNEAECIFVIGTGLDCLRPNQLISDAIDRNKMVVEINNSPFLGLEHSLKGSVTDIVPSLLKQVQEFMEACKT